MFVEIQYVMDFTCPGVRLILGSIFVRAGPSIVDNENLACIRENIKSRTFWYAVGVRRQNSLKTIPIGGAFLLQMLDYSTNSTSALLYPALRLLSVGCSVGLGQVIRSESEYIAILKENEQSLVVIKFFATWCRSCKSMDLKYRRLALEHENVKFYEVKSSTRPRPLFEENLNASRPSEHSVFVLCVVILFILDVRLVDSPDGVTQEEGHTGFLHLPSALFAFI